VESRIAVCVFCGASAKVDARYFELARAVGALLGARGVEVIYGGASVGLMGALADAALAAGGRVTGVIPASMRDRELAHTGLTELHVVGSMAERKGLMFSRATAFLALPGGFGTLDELFEAATLRQIGEHARRIAVLDETGFWAPLFAWIDAAIDARFVPENVRGAIEVLHDREALARWIDELLA
jgi:uncharacterized protein (TIGR00730 family)